MRVESKGKKNEFNRMLRNVKVLRFIKLWIRKRKRQDCLSMYVFRKMDNTSTCSIVIVNDRRSNNLSIYKIGKLNFTGWFPGEYNQ